MASASTRHSSQSPQKGIIVYEHRHQRLRLLIQQKSAPHKRLFSSKSLEHFSYLFDFKIYPNIESYFIGFN
jgi:hypothetical protein